MSDAGNRSAIARGAVAALIFLASLGLLLWLSAVRPATASTDERSILRAAAAAGLLGDGATCYSLLTSSYPAYTGGQEYGYWVSDDADDPRNAAVQRANEIARPADHAVLAATPVLRSPIAHIAAAWNHLGCSRTTTLGTPRIHGSYGFIEFTGDRHAGTAAFARTSSGWRLLSYKERDPTMPVY